MTKFKNQRIPLLGDGMAQCAMTEFQTTIKCHRGLTSFIEKRGVNGKWLVPGKPYDIKFSMLVKILEITVRFRQSDETFLDEWNEMGKKLLNMMKR